MTNKTVKTGVAFKCTQDISVAEFKLHFEAAIESTKRYITYKGHVVPSLDKWHIMFNKKDSETQVRIRCMYEPVEFGLTTYDMETNEEQND